MSRRVSLREPQSILVIVSEGEKTELKYFSNYRKRGCGLKIETPNTSKTDPLGLVKYAERQIRKNELEPDGDDEVWCVFDVDQNKENIKKAVDEAEDNDINIALSNPCFELWFLLHFELRQTELSCDDTIDNLKKYLPDYSKNQDIFYEIVDKRDEAISHAKKLNEIHSERRNNELYSPESNPSTQVFKLIEYILNHTECVE
ncbi:MAG: RloB family protein [Candidatus Aenigmatarchaeota archaeon]